MIEAIAGGILGLATGGMQANNNRKAQRSAMEYQAELNRSQAMFNKEQQLELWKDTNYSAQVEQARKAGLNPAMLYSNGGSGGTTAAAEAGGVGLPNMQEKNYGIEGVMAGLQLQQAKYQAELMKAQSRNLNAEAEDKELDNVTKKRFGQEADIIEASNRLSEAIQKGSVLYESSFKEARERGEPYNKTYFMQMLENQIDKLNLEPSKMEEEIDNLKRNNDINEATKQDVIDIVKYKAINENLDNYLKQANISLTREQERKIWHEIWQGWTNTGLKGLDLIIKGAIARTLGKKSDSWGQGFKEGVEIMKR